MSFSIRGTMLLASACLLAGTVLSAQQSQKPAVSVDAAAAFSMERSQVVPSQCCFWFKGGGADVAVTFRSGWGVAGSITGDHASNVTSIRNVNAGLMADPAMQITPNATAYLTQGVDVNKISYLAGPRYTYTFGQAGTQQRRMQLFGQGLVGWTHGFNGLYPAPGAATTSAHSMAVQAGGGLNWYLSKHWGLHLIEADYVRTALPNAAANVQNDMRLSAGVTYHFEGAAPAPVTLVCAASPASIYAGDPVTVTATAGNLDAKQNAIYSYSGAGVTGAGTTANVVTNSLLPGKYTVQCGVKEGKPGKEGMKPWQAAEASASFTVKPFDPPTIGCSASPATIKPGETSTVTASGVSPQNRPLTYSYAASSGAVNGSGATATYNSADAPSGTTTVTCNVTDDKGHTATAQTTVTILEPVRAPLPSPEIAKLEAKLALHSVFFPTSLPRVSTPNVGLVVSQQATLDDLATSFKRYLEFKPEARLILSGHADVRGSIASNQSLSERRVALTKKYLADKGVPTASIETRGFGSEKNLTAAEVKALIEQNTELSAAEQSKELHNLPVLALAQNRRVDVSLSTTGQQSVRQLPFNAADFLTLLDEKKPAASKKPAAPKKAAGKKTVK